MVKVKTCVAPASIVNVTSGLVAVTALLLPQTGMAVRSPNGAVQHLAMEAWKTPVILPVFCTVWEMKPAHTSQKLRP